jgi:flagellar hook-associated protein 3 FlgL
MRVTSQSMVRTSLRRLSQRLARYEQAQTQIATGKRILKPSDDPAGANRGLALRAAQRAHEQAARNATDARSRLEISDSQMQAGVERLGRARELALRAASGVNASERRAIADELSAIRSELQSVANFDHHRQPLFSGYSDAPPVVKVAGAWTYTGDAGQISRRVGEQDVVVVNVNAGEMFGFSATPGTDVFTKFDTLIAELGAANPNPATLSAGIADIDTAMRRLGDHQARVGAATNWVDSALQRSEDTLLSLRGELAETEDVEVASAVMELQTQQVAYEATLRALERALPPSLLSFSR